MKDTLKEIELDLKEYVGYNDNRFGQVANVLVDYDKETKTATATIVFSGDIYVNDLVTIQDSYFNEIFKKYNITTYTGALVDTNGRFVMLQVSFWL